MQVGVGQLPLLQHMITNFDTIRQFKHNVQPFLHLACGYGFWGMNCADRCDCENGEFCDPIDGECNCAPGWKGRRCDQCKFLVISAHFWRCHSESSFTRYSLEHRPTSHILSISNMRVTPCPVHTVAYFLTQCNSCSDIALLFRKFSISGPNTHRRLKYRALVKIEMRFVMLRTQHLMSSIDSRCLTDCKILSFNRRTSWHHMFVLADHKLAYMSMNSGAANSNHIPSLSLVIKPLL